MKLNGIIRPGAVAMTVTLFCGYFVYLAVADDWPMLGRDGTQNGVSPEIVALVEWTVESREGDRVIRESRGIRWSAPLGSETHSSPVFANGVLYLATRTTLFPIAADKDEPDPEQKGGYWPQWRGPNRDNVSPETGLLKEWPEAGPPLVWRVEGIGEGIASVSIADGRILTTGYVDGSEFAISMSQSSGELLWRTRIGAAIEESSLMRWLSERSPTIDGDRVYFVTALGDLVCLAVRDGRELWRKNYVKDFKGVKGQWGYCDYPLIDGDNLICTPGGADATIVALHKVTGELSWKSALPEAGTAAYAAMVVSNAGGIRQFITFLEKGLVGVAAENGRLLWRYDNLASDQNSFTPIVFDDQVLCASGRYHAGIALLNISVAGEAQRATEQYFQKLDLNRFQDNLLVLDGHVYGTTRSGPFCAELPTGRVTWQADRPRSHPRFPMNAMIAADNHLYVRQSDGVMRLIKADPGGLVIEGSFTIPDVQPSIGATHPVIAGGRCFLRDGNRLFCYDIREDALEPSLANSQTIELQPPRSEPANEPRDRILCSVFVPTPQDVVEKMLEEAAVKKSDVVYDLGSGDGRIVITAAQKYGCKAVGYELDKELVEQSRAKAEAAGIKSLVTIEAKDLFTADLREADVIAVYLLPQQLEKLVPQLEKMKSGSRVVSHQFEIPGVPAENVVSVESTEDGAKHTLYLWTLPLKKAAE